MLLVGHVPYFFFLPLSNVIMFGAKYSVSMDPSGKEKRPESRYRYSYGFAIHRSTVPLIRSYMFMYWLKSLPCGRTVR